MAEQEHANTFDHQLSEGKRKDQKKSVFEFRDVCFSVKSKGQPFGREKKEKIINHNISARVESGHVLAILGPSGAGKTTLLNALSLNAIGGETTGTITLDGKPLTEQTLRRRGFVVAQRDFHWTFLTCKETLEYAADLYCGNESKSEKQKRISKLITRMGSALSASFLAIFHCCNLT